MSEAEQIRRQWLAKMGLAQDEIDEDVDFDPPRDPERERQQLDAIREIQKV